MYEAGENVEQIKARGRYNAFVIYVKTCMNLEDVLSAGDLDGFFKVAQNNIDEIKSAFQDNWGEEQDAMVAYLQDFLDNPIAAILSLLNVQSIKSTYDEFYSNLQDLNQKEALAQDDIEELKRFAKEIIDNIERFKEFGESTDTVEFRSIISTLEEFIDHPEKFLIIHDEDEDDMGNEGEAAENNNWGNLPATSAPLFQACIESASGSDFLAMNFLVQEMEGRYKELVAVLPRSLNAGQTVKNSEIISMVNDMIDDILSNNLSVRLNAMLDILCEIKATLECIAPNSGSTGDESALPSSIMESKALHGFILDNGLGDTTSVAQSDRDNTSGVDDAQQPLPPLPNLGLNEMPFFNALEFF